MTTARPLVPDDFVLATGRTREALEHEALELLAFELFRRGQVSAGKAAELLGMNKIAFLDAASRRGIPVADLDEDELARELERVDVLARRGR